MGEYERRFRKKLREFGLSSSAITAAWPAWWSEAAEGSVSARSELRFSLARKLGLDPRSLADEGSNLPRFVWRDEARFKNLAATDWERSAIASFAMSIARIAVAATPPSTAALQGNEAGGLRHAILANQPFVRLLDLLAMCWSVGIPVLYLRVLPLEAKRMHAIAVRIDDRFAILLARDAIYPAWIAHHVAHELGHIACGHLTENSLLVDTEPTDSASAKDTEERVADQFALKLLTGHEEPVVVSTAKKVRASELAQRALEASATLRIEPGTLALCYGHSSRNWSAASRALAHIYETAQPVWRGVNQIARAHLELGSLPQDTHFFLDRVLG